MKCLENRAPRIRPVGYGLIERTQTHHHVKGGSQHFLESFPSRHNNVSFLCLQIKLVSIKSTCGEHILLAEYPLRIHLAKAVQLIKTGSSSWIHETFPNLRNSAWQQGYGVFSIGISQVTETINYIEQQVEHHRTRTFKEEYLAFLKKHDSDLDEKYLWG
jgi:REP element-mobilizing transposase RayT